MLEIRKKNPKATGAVILKLFYEETERSITDSTLRRIVKYEKKIISKERYSAELIKFRAIFRTNYGADKLYFLY